MTKLILAGSPKYKTELFYNCLRREIVEDNSLLTPYDLRLLQSHYPVMMSPEYNPVELAVAIYAERRQYPVAAILASENPLVLDAGCGYGSESFLFAALGARVIAVDLDPEKIRIAQLRQAYYEEIFDKTLDISFSVADLDTFVPPIDGLSLTWIAAVLAAVPNQERLLKSIFDATRDYGQIMLTDLNLWNPLFLFDEWRRRKRAMQNCPTFAKQADFVAMFNRRGRMGARYFSYEQGEVFDDVQFFSVQTLGRLLKSVGFRPTNYHFSGYVPPFLARFGLTRLESMFARFPLLSRFGYFYLAIGSK